MCTQLHAFIYSIPEPTLNIHTPGIPTLLVCAILIILCVSDPVMLTKLSPALIPARASLPPNLLVPVISPVVHFILPSAYRNITNDSTPLVVSTHWNVLVYNDPEYVISIENIHVLYIFTSVCTNRQNINPFTATTDTFWAQTNL